MIPSHGRGRALFVISDYSYTRIRQRGSSSTAAPKLAAHDHPPETMCPELAAVTDQLTEQRKRVSELRLCANRLRLPIRHNRRLPCEAPESLLSFSRMVKCGARREGDDAATRVHRPYLVLR